MRLKFGPPTGSGSKGWPTFDKDGKRIREEGKCQDTQGSKPSAVRKRPAK